MKIQSILFVLITGLLSLSPTARAQDAGSPLPPVLEHPDPIYPPLARQARVSGEVELSFMTDGHSVVSVEILSGNDLLRKAAEDDLRAWKFAPHEPGTFRVTFRFQLEGDGYTVFLPASAFVLIVEPLPVPTAYYAWPDLVGKWTIQIRSARGSFNTTFRYNYTGPNRCWVDGEIGDERLLGGCLLDREQVLSFDALVPYPKGETLHTYFVGKIKGDRITGSFVDEEGLTGTWMATREKQTDQQK